MFQDTVNCEIAKKSIALVTIHKHRGNTTWIGANPNLGNMVAKELIQQGLITEALLGDTKSSITKVQSEVTMPKSPKKDESNVRYGRFINPTVFSTFGKKNPY